MQKRRLIYQISTGAHLVGLMLFISWVSQTDMMFGHYSGPLELLSIILFCATLGLAGYSFLGISKLFGSKETTEQAKPSCMMFAATIFLTIFSFLAILIAITELKQALRYKRLYGSFDHFEKENSNQLSSLCWESSALAYAIHKVTCKKELCR
jgi:dolichyl-phosphate-mannose--protein O-mannosyl transferase